MPRINRKKTAPKKPGNVSKKKIIQNASIPISKQQKLPPKSRKGPTKTQRQTLLSARKKINKVTLDMCVNMNDNLPIPSSSTVVDDVDVDSDSDSNMQIDGSI
ncbi:unnamed protein product [Didymodactylos carnosus]|uniref:Uncharacterized protein n=1 Tax=Didymodactylos carnosus TaxID=1234261 RepID=A0A8S2ZPT7_9BILA|nr:unnamed protein product [Didymodactylos carnosus]